MNKVKAPKSLRFEVAINSVNQTIESNSGKTVTAAQLTDAVTATRSVVDGFWMNVPGQSAECPTCTQPLPGLAVTVLRALYHL